MKPKRNPSAILGLVLSALVLGAFAVGRVSSGEATVTEATTAVPEACLVALDKGAILSDQLQLSVDWLIALSDAGSRLDASAIHTIADEMKVNAGRPEIQNVVTDFDEAARACREEAK